MLSETRGMAAILDFLKPLKDPGARNDTGFSKRYDIDTIFAFFLDIDIDIMTSFPSWVIAMSRDLTKNLKDSPSITDVSHECWFLVFLFHCCIYASALVWTSSQGNKNSNIDKNNNTCFEQNCIFKPQVLTRRPQAQVTCAVWKTYRKCDIFRKYRYFSKLSKYRCIEYLVSSIGPNSVISGKAQKHGGRCKESAAFRLWRGVCECCWGRFSMFNLSFTA